MRLNIRSLPGFASLMLASLTVSVLNSGVADDSTSPPANLAVMAQVTSIGGGQGGGNPQANTPINNGIDPANSGDRDHGAIGGRRGGRGNRGGPPPEGTQTFSLQYQWTQPVSTKAIDIYWLVAEGGRGGGAVRPPK